ncbi:MFS transporter [Mycolicibacterium sp. GCM10028919]|uniref:MFS transporter n=1 Tax=Mycolicibacterium sp. GCM10028919 TaxID=3273401 RepID=UPI003609E33B
MPIVAVAYLGSHFLSVLGNGIAAVALPLIVLQTTGSPLSVGAVSAATAVPALVVGLCAGIVLDRVNRRTCSVLADVVSAGSIAAIPLVDFLWSLDMGWFIALAIAGSFGDVPGMTARQVLVPAVAQHTGVSLERLVGLRQSMTSTALVIGPATAGALLSLFDGSTVLLATAATSAAAAALTFVMPRRLGAVDTTPDRRDPLWTQLTAGVAALRHNGFLAGTVTLTVGLVVVIGGLQGLVLPLYFSLLARPDLLGFVLTSLAIGMLCGTGTFAAVGPRLPRRLWMTTALLGTTVGFLLIATLISPAVVFAGAALFGVANAILGAVLGVLQAERIPDPVRGRVLGVQNACLQIAGPAGIGLAGVVAEYGSAVAAGLAVVAIWLVIATVLVVSRVFTDLEPDADVGSGSVTSRGVTK